MFNPLNFISKFVKSSNQKELDRIDKIIHQINLLEENTKKLGVDEFPKKTNELNRKKIVENNSKIKTKSNEINKIEVKEVRKLQEKNKFMSNIERENALAELIIDMELYHLNTLND